MTAVPGSQPDEPTDRGASDAEPAALLATRPLVDAGGAAAAAEEPASRPLVDAGGAEAVTGELDRLADRPLAEHPAAYERIHARLQESLTEIDDA